MLLEHQVPIMSFYFGLPEPDLLSEIRKAGVYTIGNATCLKEAQYLQEAGTFGFAPCHTGLEFVALKENGGG